RRWHPAQSGPGWSGFPYGWLSVYAMLALAASAACFTDSFPVRIWRSMVRRMLPFSTSTQCFACGTNQLRFAARLLTELLRRFVAFGMLPTFWSSFSFFVLVKALIHAIAWAEFLLCPGTARSEPPRKPGIDLPATWLGITNCPVTFAYFLPVQQLNQPGPKIAEVRPFANTWYGAGFVSSSVSAEAGDVALKKFL